LIFLNSLLVVWFFQIASVLATTPDSLEELANQDLLIRTVEKFEEVSQALSQNEADPCKQDTISSWVDTVPKLKSGQKLKADEVLFVTHASNYFNHSLSIKENLNKRIKEAKAKGIVVIYLVDTLVKRFISEYFLDHKPDYLLLSSGGDHQIKLRAKNLIFSGGFFEACAAETARDAFLNNDPKIPLRATYLTDSLYIRDGGKGGTPLKTELSGRTDQEILHFLERNYFIEGALGDQNWHTERYANFKNFTFKIFRDGREIGKFGRGRRSVEMNFVIESQP